MRHIDLHTHSTASDGSCTPSELVEQAEKLGLAAIALTDHDTVSGLREFLARGEGSSVKLVPGVEIAVSWCYRELHILGFFVDDHCAPLNSLLEEIRHNRDGRNDLIIAKLRASGFDISMEEVLEVANGESVGRPHISKILVNKGYFKDNKAVFSSCLARGGSGYMPRILPEPPAAIDAIHAAGGVAFWAHPAHRDKSDTSTIKSILQYLVGLGLDGVEAYYPEFSPKQHQTIMAIAAELGLPISGGSDYHGVNQPGIDLGSGRGGLDVPEELYLKIVEYHAAFSRQRLAGV